MIKDRPEISKKISDYINLAPQEHKLVLQKLRKILQESKLEIIEDWKWGPNYNYFGMVWGIGYFKKHIKLTFFNGAYLSDKYQLFNSGFDNEHNRSYNIELATEVKWKGIQEYIEESCSYNEKNNTKKEKILKPKIKVQLEIPELIINYLKPHNKELDYLQNLAHTHKKEYINWILGAKKVETQHRRLEKMLQMLQDKKHI